ncbi:hypothetical protein KIN20_009453 [Parelaphostrongylus tenuis]|uniref:Uncharacterized protein n=1 Tax=Parelaphostrongylus tenuis TaxID=148309 RepID=A0AAD5MSJ8_PARTN|nr:hypothetical protein KIN20_009453 [Parelaphostrongylus tenuis]
MAKVGIVFAKPTVNRHLQTKMMALRSSKGPNSADSLELAASRRDGQRQALLLDCCNQTLSCHRRNHPAQDNARLHIDNFTKRKLTELG